MAAESSRTGPVAPLVAATDLRFRPDIPGYIARIRPMLSRVEGPFAIKGVTARTFAGVTIKTLVLQAGSQGHWAVASVMLRTSDQVPPRLVGLYVTPYAIDPARANAFDLHRRGLAGYAFLATMALCPLACIWAVVLIWRRRWLQRRWVWTLGSLVGLFGLGVNWTTGTWAILFVNVSLLGAQVHRIAPYGPYTLSFGIPVIALMVIGRWYRRREETAPI